MAKKASATNLHTVKPAIKKDNAKPSKIQLAYLQRGLSQPGGKLPLFNHQGQRFSERTVQSCIEHGWAEPWFNNPLKPDWLVCKITDAGRKITDEI